MTELPKIISVDDHVVEPAHLWQERLPERMRAQGPRVERARWRRNDCRSIAVGRPER